VAQNLDFLLIGRFLGAGLLGEYALAYNLATLPQGRLAPALVRVMLPLFARVQADNAVIRRSYLRLVRGMALISFPFLTGLALLGPALLPAVYGPKWRGALAPLPALCIAGAAYAMSTTVGALYRSKGRGDRELAIAAARALLLAGCIITALSGWGTAKAVSVAVAGYAVISTFAFQPVANRLIDLRMRDYLAALLPGAIAAGVVATALEMPRSGLFGAASVTLVGVTLWRDRLGWGVFGLGCSVFGPAGSKPSSPLSDPTPKTEHRTPTTEEAADAV
jgi:PST family polysaccharide transporter